jgi:hypothetical protein
VRGGDFEVLRHVVRCFRQPLTLLLSPLLSLL